MFAFALIQEAAQSDLGNLGGGAWDYAKLILTLGAVLVAAFVVLRYLPRLTGVRQVSSGAIRVAARVPLEPRKTLYIVKAGGEYLLIATSETGVHRLGPLDAAQVEPCLSTADEVERRPADFARLVGFGRSRKASGGGQ